MPIIEIFWNGAYMGLQYNRTGSGNWTWINHTLCPQSHVYFSVGKDAIASVERWEHIKKNLWKGLDKFGNVYDTVIWDNGPSGQCVHDSCRMTLSNSIKWDQAKQRLKRNVADRSPSLTPSTSYSDLIVEAPSNKRLRSSLGVIYDKTKCVWCCKGESKKQPETHLILLSYNYAWAAFKSHTVVLEDQVMKDWINCLIDSALCSLLSKSDTI